MQNEKRCCGAVAVKRGANTVRVWCLVVGVRVATLCGGTGENGRRGVACHSMKRITQKATKSNATQSMVLLGVRRRTFLPGPSQLESRPFFLNGLFFRPFISSLLSAVSRVPWLGDTFLELPLSELLVLSHAA